MSCRGKAYRLYRASDHGSRSSFVGVAVVLDESADDIVFRWAASTTKHSFSRKEWDAYIKEETSLFKVLLPSA